MKILEMISVLMVDLFYLQAAVFLLGPSIIRIYTHNGMLTVFLCRVSEHFRNFFFCTLQKSSRGFGVEKDDCGFFRKARNVKPASPVASGYVKPTVTNRGIVLLRRTTSRRNDKAFLIHQITLQSEHWML